MTMEYKTEHLDAFERMNDAAIRAGDSYEEDLAEWRENGGEGDPNWDEPVVWLDRNGYAGWYWGGDTGTEASHSRDLCIRLSDFERGWSYETIMSEIGGFLTPDGDDDGEGDASAFASTVQQIIDREE